MSALYLIRHGQAGSLDDYDKLSETGRAQSRLLGAYLAGQQIRFAAAYSGSLRRQIETAEEVRRACDAMPEITVDPRWNEFDLEGVYRGIAPQLAAEDQEFRRQLAAVRSEDRDWTACGMALVEAWIEGRYSFEGESWAAFLGRIRGALEALRKRPGGQAVAVFTSATPMAIVAAMALGVTDGTIMKLAGVTFNTAMTTLRVQPHDLTLFLFNGVAHLTPELRTFR